MTNIRAMTSPTPYVHFPGTARDGYLADGPVALFGSDVTGDEPPFRSEGMMLALLGAAAPSTLRTWFSRLSDGGQIADTHRVRGRRERLKD